MLNLLVIRSDDLEKAQRFYELIGLRFEPHQHGKGSPHLAAEHDGFVFEIYPSRGKDTTATRFGFAIEHIQDVFDNLVAAGAQAITAPQDSQWGRRAVVTAPDGHTIELVERA